MNASSTGPVEVSVRVHEPQKASILPMEESSIQRIVAGQAVTDLASATKELIDNALDAGAKSINIRLFNQGIDIVEVSDDGCGVPAASRPYLATKHATSKIRSFEDIYNGAATTLGFRGEALFCLANLSKSLVIASRTAENSLGQKMEFRSDGTMDEKKLCSVPRKVGTTVCVNQLFAALPVRRADMIKRIKAQRAKLVSLVQGYAILCLGVRFNLMDIVGKSHKEETKLRTSNTSTTVEQTISSILGSKFLSGMTRIKIDLSSVLPDASVQGLVSKAPALVARDGSVARESQFFSINGRPVELPKISRVLGEAWRTVEGAKRRPACVLCLELPHSEYDVNLSPNKREVLLTHEAEICALIHEAALKLWSSQNDGNFAANAVAITPRAEDTSSKNKQNGRGITASPERTSPYRRMKRRNAFVHDFSKAKLQHEEDDRDTTHSSYTPNTAEHRKIIEPVSNLEPATSAPAVSARVETSAERPTDSEKRQWASAQARFNENSQRSQQDEIESVRTATRQPTATCPIDTKEMDSPAEETNQPPRQKKLTLQDFAFRPLDARKERGIAPASTTNAQSLSTPRESKIDHSTSNVRASQNGRKRTSSASLAGPAKSKVKAATAPSSPNERNDEQRHSPEENDAEFEDACSTIVNNIPPSPHEDSTLWNSFQGTDFVIQAARQERQEMRETKDKLRSIAKERRASKDSEGTSNIDENMGVPDVKENDDSIVEDNTDGVVRLSKADFGRMTVIGQFNLGFILAKCPQNHLWILDQHACDEKYNFERLCTQTVIHEQPLLAPMPLELFPSEESCILENMEIFEKNGFRFQHHPDKSPRHRLSLTALPHSGAQDGRKAVQFGPDDVRALCSILDGTQGDYTHDGGTGADGSGLYGNNAVRRYAMSSSSQANSNINADKVIARLPKAIAMFANRACRGSIMIGTSLSEKEMQTVVHRLADVQHPWNCPHGRPTLRHVRDVLGTLLQDEAEAAATIAGPTVAVMTQMSQEEEGDGEMD